MPGEIVNPDPFHAPGRWFRGNLPTHSTGSDGSRSPREVATWYREHGYDFVALTDHDVRTDVDDMSTPGFLVLPGVETHPGLNSVGEVWHLLGLGVHHSHHFGRGYPVQAAIDELRADGGLVWIGHPYWTGLTLAEMIDIEGIIGLEVSNSTCACFGRGVSAVHWDDLLAHGRQLWGLAVDDAHWVRPDYGAGWVMVRAPELSREAILRALAAGSFYASQGPEIYDFQVTAHEIWVRCSPAQSIDLVGPVGMGGDHAAAPEPDQPLTEFTFRRAYQRQYVRAEVRDAQGHTAWSPPIWL